MQYKEEELLRLAKRFHNTKRTYLLVDPLQGKHLAVSPSAALDMMHELGNKVREEYGDTKLIIGFAETATAVGMAVAESVSPDCVYISTTREEISDEKKWIEFSEEHSHAVEQKLSASGLIKWIDKTDSIIFVDDEISTGKTLINIVEQMKKACPGIEDKKLVAASIINRVSEENLQKMRSHGLECISLLKLDEADYTSAVERYVISGAKEPDSLGNALLEAAGHAGNDADFSCDIMESEVQLKNFRLGVLAGEYHNNCMEFAGSLIKRLDPSKLEGDVLILGTEECMYPAIMTGLMMEQAGASHVFTHSTTRSPIGLCPDEEYPVKSGYKLKSFYDSNRDTFVYNLRRYDMVIIVTDSRSISYEATASVTCALRESGNKNILIVRG